MRPLSSAKYNLHRTGTEDFSEGHNSSEWMEITFSCYGNRQATGHLLSYSSRMVDFSLAAAQGEKKS